MPVRQGGWALHEPKPRQLFSRRIRWVGVVETGALTWRGGTGLYLLYVTQEGEFFS